MVGWFRVFAPIEKGPEPAVIMEALQKPFPGIHGRFRTDDQGWFQVILMHSALGTLAIERFDATETGVRAHLNTWAAFLESHQQFPLMEKLISSKQVFTMEFPADEEEEPGTIEHAKALAMSLAEITGGIAQVDGLGFLNPSGEVMVADEDPAGEPE